MTHNSILLPIGSMYGIFTYIWLILMVSAGKNTAHASYGLYQWLIMVQKGPLLLNCSWFVTSITRTILHALPKVIVLEPLWLIWSALKWHEMLWIKWLPIGSMYGVFGYIYLKNQPNVGKYTIHGSYGLSPSKNNLQLSLQIRRLKHHSAGTKSKIEGCHFPRVDS